MAVTAAFRSSLGGAGGKRWIPNQIPVALCTARYGDHTANFARTGGEADCVDEPDAAVAQLDQALALPGLELAIDALPGRTDKNRELLL